MAVVVCFITTRGVGSIDTPGVGFVRVRENIALNGTTTAIVQDGEVVVVGNAENSMVVAAFGTTPDASALVATADTSAGYPIPSGSISDPFMPPVGSKINVKVVV